MSANHPLWAQVDVPTARKALEKLDTTLDGRLAKAKTPKEKAYLEAVDKLFNSPGDKLARDKAYAAAMTKMYEQWPDDHEVDIFYALSLLGTVRPGDQGFKRQAIAASIAMNVYQANPNHPGGAHFIIHSFDDPDHAILALPAARTYAKIAPSAPHALHMPSHIFVQLGMWSDVAASNTVAYKAATDLNARMHLQEGREDFHTLSWLQYANLMMGRIDEAKKNLDLAKAADERNPGNAGVHSGYLGMRARQILETGKWEKIPLEEPAGGQQSGTSAMPPMSGMPAGGRSYGTGNWVFVTGFSAAKLGDTATAERAAAQLKATRDSIESSGDAYAAKPFGIMEKEVAAVTRFAQGQKDEGVKLAKEAADIELTLSKPSGPVEPIKPAFELYGDLLLEAGRASEAAVAYEQSLQRTANRTPSVKGLERAKSLGAKSTAAERQR
jgi:tetratricopeptide (TPR) repeat protein